MNSGCCKVSIPSGMDNLSFYCRCLILVLACILVRLRSCWKDRRYMLVRIVVCLKVRGGLLVSMVQIVMQVLLRLYGNFLEK